ncbi:hypothetical protein AAG570_009585, partial [Ranatra chinensis]
EPPVPALGELDTDEFTSRLVRKVHTPRPLVVVFLEESLSVEDLAWRGAFPQLRNITAMSYQSEFIPSVEDPVMSIKDMAESQGYTWKVYKGGETPSLAPGNLLEVHLSEPLTSEDRPRMLLRHDSDIANIYSKLVAGSNQLIAIFTGKQSSWVEAEGEAVNSTSSGQEFVFNSENMALLYSSKYPVLYDGNETYPLENKSPDIVSEHTYYYYTYYKANVSGFLSKF